MKRFEIIDKGNKRYMLTIAIDRVTIKLQANSTIDEQLRIIKFFKWVARQPQLINQIVTFRGRTSPPPVAEKPLRIQMTNESGSMKFNFTENANSDVIGENEQYQLEEDASGP